MGKLVGLGVAKQNLQALAAGLKGQDVLTVFGGAAELVADRARELAAYDPVHHHPAADPHLRDTIKAGAPYFSKGGAPNALVRVTSEHGVAVEYGTSKMAAEPYLRPAMDELKDAIASQVAAGMEQVVKDSIR